MRAPMPLLAIGLVACVAVPEAQPEEPVERELGAEGTCDPRAGETLIGQRATRELGMRAQELTGASIFRWAPPDSAVTMDYRADRVTVSYGRDLQVTRIACG